MSFRIVIAEDEFLLANNLKSMVESLHHEVVGLAETGAEAVTMASEHTPDLILMDIKLPEIDGITAARMIAQQWQIPIIIISAFSDRSYIEGAAEAGVMTYLVKPVSLADLQAVIDLTMARSRELMALRQEVGDLKKALSQRKIVERAKGILMDRGRMSEGEAFHRLQQMSQLENRPMVEIARAVITAHSLMNGPGEAPSQ
ncbi:MAG TPA: response regulator [Armatimonadota bacterium]